MPDPLTPGKLPRKVALGLDVKVRFGSLEIGVGVVKKRAFQGREQHEPWGK